ncbi:MAG: AAA family ATPase, partial [Oscillospiraceae bacterium]|nr:AAA family ATPase [Oscillospiraceae bacterium]
MVAVNLDDIDFEHLLDYKILYKYIKSKLLIDKYTYIFIDEVQQCPNFEKAVDSLYIKENVDIYITGSNAYMLSGELATLLS